MVKNRKEATEEWLNNLSNYAKQQANHNIILKNGTLWQHVHKIDSHVIQIPGLIRSLHYHHHHLHPTTDGREAITCKDQREEEEEEREQREELQR